MKLNNDWLTGPCKTIDLNAAEAARNHQATLTKPSGSLGRLEEIALKFAGWQGLTKPVCDDILVRIFAGDHGICQQGVSAFSQQVTGQMVANFVRGGAAISVLSKAMNADFAVINMGIITPCEHTRGVVNIQLAKGTRDFTQAPAMSLKELTLALSAGQEQLSGHAPQLFIGGDMGIGNTTSASAIYSLLLELAPEITVGPGTGIDACAMAVKRKVLYQAFNHHADALNSPLDILQRVGGLEIAGLVGAYITAAQKGVPILIDGFISTAAALLATRINPEVTNWMLFAHKSAEPAHIHALQALNAQPLLDLNMRLGEGSGAAVAVTLLQSALILHSEMATFNDARVSHHV